MYDGDYYRLMAEYNQWMNQKLYALCTELSDDQRKQDRGAFFGSIHGTLNHLLYGDKAWYGRFIGKPLQGVKIGEELHADFAALRTERELLDAEILGWAEKVSQDWLLSAFTFTSGVDGKTRTMPAWVLVTQMFNHQTHHRGQITTLLKQMEIDPGPTDIPWLPALTS